MCEGRSVESDGSALVTPLPALTGVPGWVTTILVVDVEATCWRGAPPPGEQNEIIEVGICLLDAGTGTRREGRGILVRPERSRLSPFCTELTTLTQELVDTGISFAEACSLLRGQYRSREHVWASFGDYDRLQFRGQCESFGVEYPFGPHHLNVKRLATSVLALRKPSGMAGVLRRLGLPLTGTHHRGVDDAWNIALILHHLLERRFGPNPATHEQLLELCLEQAEAG